MRTALEEICAGHRCRETVREECGWKLSPSSQDVVASTGTRWSHPTFQVVEQVRVFRERRLGALISASRVCNIQAATARQRKSRRFLNDLERQASRAEALVHMGELSSTKQALEGAEVAPGCQNTLDLLRDESKRPWSARVPIPPTLANLEQSVQFILDENLFTRNLRSAKRGSAGGPTGTVEQLHPLLDHAKDSHLFFQVAEFMARAQVPGNVIRMGRLTALRKPDGGVRGFVAGIS